MLAFQFGFMFGSMVGIFIHSLIPSTFKPSRRIDRAKANLSKRLLAIFWSPLKTPAVSKTISVSELWISCFTDANDGKCIHGIFGTGKPCNIGIGAANRVKADTLRLYLLNIRPDHNAAYGFVDTLAQSWLCSVHKKLIHDKVFWGSQIERWIEELTDNFRSKFDDMLSDLSPRHQQLILEKVYPTSTNRKQISKSRVPGEFPLSQSTDSDGEDMIDDAAIENPKFISDFTKRVQQRYRDCFDSENIDDVTDLPNDTPGLTSFTPHNSRCKDDAISCLVESRLSDSETESGCIYIYQTVTGGHVDYRDYVKIGYTTISDKTRLSQWGKQCGYPIKQIGSFDNIEHVKRTEKLIHTELELLGKRRDNNRCTLSSGKCKTKHQEWFEVSIPEAIRTVKYWTNWINHHKPYSADGALKLEMMQAIYTAQDQSVRQSYLDFLSDSQGNPWYSYHNILSNGIVPNTPPKKSKTSNTSPRSVAKPLPTTSQEQAQATVTDLFDMVVEVDSHTYSPEKSNRTASRSSRGTPPKPRGMDKNTFGTDDTEQGPSGSPASSLAKRGRTSGSPRTSKSASKRSGISKQDNRRNLNSLEQI